MFLNNDNYQERKELELKEKMFFTNKIDLKKYDLIVHFGCETGTLLRRISNYTDEKTRLIGYDVTSLMVETCEDATPLELRNKINYTADRADLMAEVERSKRSLIIFSSILHKISINEQINISNDLMPYFDTVVIRDMKAPVNNVPISNVTRKRVLHQVAPWQAELFESQWGKIRDKDNLYRFFLMNEFIDNFENEVEEDYFSVQWSTIAENLLSQGYKRIYERSYTLDYRKKQVKHRFNHVMKDITHREIILSRWY